MKKVYEPINFLHAKVFQHKILVPIKNKLFIYNESYNKDSVITTEDDILNFHPITNDKVVILGKTNKTIWHYNMRGELVNK